MENTSSPTNSSLQATTQAASQDDKFTVLKWQLAFWFLTILTVAALYWGFVPVFKH